MFLGENSVQWSVLQCYLHFCIMLLCSALRNIFSEEIDVISVHYGTLFFRQMFMLE